MKIAESGIYYLLVILNKYIILSLYIYFILYLSNIQ
jgi:hypothetical protein